MSSHRLEVERLKAALVKVGARVPPSATAGTAATSATSAASAPAPATTAADVENLDGNVAHLGVGGGAGVSAGQGSDTGKKRALEEGVLQAPGTAGTVSTAGAGAGVLSASKQARRSRKARPLVNAGDAGAAEDGAGECAQS